VTALGSAESRADVVIIGGGIAGLAAGASLKASGLKVVLCEADDELGGRARSWRDEFTGDVVDIGPHIIHNYYCNMLGLLERLGTLEQVVWDRQQLTTLAVPAPALTMKLWHLPPPLHLLPAALAVAQVSLADKLSNLRVGWLAMSIRKRDIAALDAISGEQLVNRLGVTPAFRNWGWASAAMTVLNVPLERASAGALMRFVRQAAGHNDIRLGFAGAGLADLFVAPCVEAIRHGGGEIRLNAAVERIEVDSGAVQAVVLRDASRIVTRHCIVAVEPQSLPALLPPAARLVDPAALLSLRASPYISTYLWFARKLTHKKSWGRMWSPDNLNFDFYDLSNIRHGWRERPSVIASNIMYAQRAQHLSDAEIVAATLREIAEYLPEAANTPLLHSRVHRAPMGIACCEPGTDRLRPATRTAVDGLLIAGDFVQTDIPLCMESAVRSSLLAAEQIWQAIGKPRRLARELPEPEGLCAVVRHLAPGSGMGAAIGIGDSREPARDEGGTRSLVLRALGSGSVASLASSLAVSFYSRRETGATATATNATSHWLWKQPAAQGKRVNVRNTLAGYLIHHAMSLLWAAAFEASPGTPVLARAATTAAVGFVVDYCVTPPRMRPGFEARVSRPAIAAFYVAFGLGLAMASLLKFPCKR
jgi:uncharacterized protein with NAD-binding domain and iron-sulfur cluster